MLAVVRVSMPADKRKIDTTGCQEGSGKKNNPGEFLESRGIMSIRLLRFLCRSRSVQGAVYPGHGDRTDHESQVDDHMTD